AHARADGVAVEPHTAHPDARRVLVDGGLGRPRGDRGLDDPQRDPARRQGLSDAAQTCRRVVTTRKRLATNAPSVYAAFAAGLAPVPWKSLNAAVWFTKTCPVRFSDRATPASIAASRARSS